MSPAQMELVLITCLGALKEKPRYLARSETLTQKILFFENLIQK